jgi:hypothetical protein
VPHSGVRGVPESLACSPPGSPIRSSCETDPPLPEFAPDSLLEEAGFELSVPPRRGAVPGFAFSVSWRVAGAVPKGTQFRGRTWISNAPIRADALSCRAAGQVRRVSRARGVIANFPTPRDRQRIPHGGGSAWWPVAVGPDTGERVCRQCRALSISMQHIRRAVSAVIMNISSEISTSDALSDRSKVNGRYRSPGSLPTYPSCAFETPRAIVSLIVSGFRSRGNNGDA